MSPDEAMREIFHQVIKMVILFGGVAIFYIWLEAKLFKKWKRRRGRNERR